MRTLKAGGHKAELDMRVLCADSESKTAIEAWHTSTSVSAARDLGKLDMDIARALTRTICGSSKSAYSLKPFLYRNLRPELSSRCLHHSRAHNPAKSFTTLYAKRVLLPPRSHCFIAPPCTSLYHARAMSDQRTSENHSRDLTWRDYDPQGGMPLVTGDISASDLHEILGRDVDPEVGNWILRLVNYRRQSGSLIESGVSFPSDQGISTNVAHKALEYLRRIQPELDEQEAGRIWAQEQLEMLEEEYVERAQSSILYEKTPDIQSPREEESVLINTRKANAAALRESDAAEKAAAKASDLAASQATQRADGDKSSQKMVTVAQDALKAKQMTNRAPVPKAWLQPAKRKEWVKQYEQKAQVLDDQPVQKIPAIRRLGPSAFVTLLTLSGCVYLHAHYDPTLDPLGRVFPNVSSTTATIGALVAIMTTAFVAYRMPPLWRIFNTYFVTIPAAPAASSMILAIFTHRSLSHLLVNCAMLAAFGRFCTYYSPCLKG